MAKKTTKSAASKTTTRTTARSGPQSEFSQPRKRQPFTVFLVMDNQTARESLAAGLRNQQIEVHDYMTAMEFYRDYRKPVPGVLITEVHPRGMSGIELLTKLTAEKNNLPLAFIAGHKDSPVAAQGVQAGAVDFLLKPVTEDRLLALVARAYAMHYDTDWDFVCEDLDDIEKSLSRVSEREREVLDLVVDGCSSREIADQLGVSAKTIEAHRARINDKLRADDLPHLVRMMMAYREEQNA